MSALFELFADTRAVLGESAVWCEWDRSLYWLDVLGGIVYRRKGDGGNPEEFERFEWNIGKIGGISFTREKVDSALRGSGKSLGMDSRKGARALHHAPDRQRNPFQQSGDRADGTVFCTVAPLLQGGIGSLWRMDLQGKFSCIEAATSGMPNGLGFSPDHRKLYFTVTTEGKIYSYDFEMARGGHVSNKDVFVQIPRKRDGRTG